MTNTAIVQTPGTSTDAYYYRMTWQEWCELSTRLRPAEVKVLLYLRTLDPFGERWQRLQVSDIADDLGLCKGTVSKALRTLADQGDIDLDLQAVTVRVNFFDQEFPTGNRFPRKLEKILESSEKSCRKHLNDRSDMKPAPSKGFKNEGCTNCFKNFKTKQLGTVPAPEKNEQEGIGTLELLPLISQSGVNPNKTIERTLIRLQRFHDAPAARRVVENALSAVEEQMQLGNVRNPQAMLVAALKRGFTANEAKRQVRDDSPPPPAAPPDPITIAQSIDQALLQGDREFARSRLQQLWATGGRQHVEELLSLRRDWRFKLSPNGVEDKT